MQRRRHDARRMRELVAVVDLGSTAVRFLLAEVKPERSYRVVAEERVPTRLGGGVPGTLPRDAIDETLRAVHRFFRRHTDPTRGPRVIAVATSAVRNARNAERLLGPLRYEEGIEVQVLSAHDEARLGAEAALRSLPVRHAVVADLGGSSLQLSRVRGGRIVATDSVPLGAVRVTREFLRHDPPRPRELRALRREIRERLHGVLRPAEPGELVVGMGGTVRTLARMHLRAHPGERKHRHGLVLQQSEITAIRERLESVSLRKRRKIRGLRAERADIILAGAIVVEEMLVFGGYLGLMVCNHGVRDGILLHETFNGRG
jgi:exopolyphosphatase/guanosine-5'-triphosphate,3'-diphosphate pyrophosphatase